MFVTMILCFFLINLLDPLGVNEVQYLLAEGDSSIDTGQAFLTVCWSSTICDSVRRCSWRYTKAVCLHSKIYVSISFIFMLSLPWGENQSSMSLFSLISLSQTVLTRLVTHAIYLTSHVNILSHNETHIVHSWFL